ncbi:hypothetical protein UT300012_21360 [Paraclostridium bifermentans]
MLHALWDSVITFITISFQVGWETICIIRDFISDILFNLRLWF